MLISAITKLKNNTMGATYDRRTKNSRHRITATTRRCPTNTAKPVIFRNNPDKPRIDAAHPFPASSGARHLASTSPNPEKHSGDWLYDLFRNAFCRSQQALRHKPRNSWFPKKQDVVYVDSWPLLIPVIDKPNEKHRPEGMRQRGGCRREDGRCLSLNSRYAALLRNASGRPSFGCGYKSGANWWGVISQLVNSLRSRTRPAGSFFTHLETACCLRFSKPATLGALPALLIASFTQFSV